MSIESNKVIARRIVREILVEGREASIPELFTDDFYSHAWSPMYGPGGGGVEGIIRFTKGAFRNVQCEILDIIAEEDRAATFFTYYAEHIGDMFGLPGNGRCSRSRSCTSCASTTARCASIGGSRTS